MPARSFTERRVGVVGGLLVALGPVGLALYTPAMPAVVADLDTTEGAVKLTMTAYFVGLAIAQLVCGPLSDAYGRRPVTLGFLALFVAASLACALAGDVETLVAARFLQGFGASAGLAVTRAMVRDRFDGEPAARLYNLIGLVLAVGPAVSPSIGAAALAVTGWHGVFLAMLLYGAAIAAVFFALIPETHPAPDFGALAPRRLAGDFRRLLLDPVFLKPALIVAVAIGGLHASTAFMPFVLIGDVGLSPMGFAVVMLIQTAAYIAATLLVRALLKRHAARRLLDWGVAAILAGGLAALLLPRAGEATVATVMAPMVVWMLGIALVMPGASSAALSPFPRIAGSASAMLGFLQLSGGFLGSAAAALFADPVNAYATVIPAMAAVALLAVLIPAPLRPAGEAPAE